jgi:hypothetical protein
MIHASIYGKTLYHRRFQPKHLDEYSAQLSNELKRTQEDELTSLFFGTLLYLSPEFVARIAARLLRTSGLHGKVDETWLSGKISLWERREGTEPDVVIRLTNQTHEIFTLIVEVKWFASEGNSQLEREWGRLTTAEKKSAAVIFLTKYRSDHLQDCGATFSHSLGTLTWFDVLAMLRAIANDSNSAEESHWLSDQVKFLSKIGLASFFGFARLHSISEKIQEFQLGSTIYYDGFRGLQRIQQPCLTSTPTATPCFWQPS